MPYSPKATRFFRAVEHGWEPPASMHSKLTPAKAKELLSHTGKKKKSAETQRRALA